LKEAQGNLAATDEGNKKVFDDILSQLSLMKK
jgi:hypothetical protein